MSTNEPQQTRRYRFEELSSGIIKVHIGVGHTELIVTEQQWNPIRKICYCFGADFVETNAARCRLIPENGPPIFFSYSWHTIHCDEHRLVVEEQQDRSFFDDLQVILNMYLHLDNTDYKLDKFFVQPLAEINQAFLLRNRFPGTVIKAGPVTSDWFNAYVPRISTNFLSLSCTPPHDHIITANILCDNLTIGRQPSAPVDSPCWVRYEHLKYFQNEVILIWRSLLDNMALFKFLMKWTEGDFPRLKYIRVTQHERSGDELTFDETVIAQGFGPFLLAVPTFKWPENLGLDDGIVNALLRSPNTIGHGNKEGTFVVINEADVRSFHFMVWKAPPELHVTP